MSEATPAGWAPTDWIGLLSPWRTSMPPASRANLICRGTDCIPSGVTREDRGAFRFRATGGSPSDSKTVTCMMSIWSTTTSEREETMAMKNPPHPGRGIRENCLEPLGLSVTEAAEVLGVARHTLSRVLNGHAAISPDMAIRLEKAGWSSADFWLRRQTSYDLAQGRRPDTGRTLPATAHSVGNPKVWIGGQGSGNSHPGLAGRTEVASPIGSGPSCLVGTPDRRNLPKHDLSEKT